MTIYLPGQLMAFLQVGDSEIPLSTSNDQFICIRDNVKQILPTVEIIIPDFTKAVSGNTLVSDGTKLQVVISSGNSNTEPVRFFTSFGTPKRSPYIGSDFIHMIGILDGCADMVRASVGRSFNDTSYNVMKSAADTYGLTFNSNVSSTNDSMGWRGARQHWGNFLRYVADHGYAQDGSFMSFAIDSNKNLFYNDVTLCMKSQARKAMLLVGSSATEMNNVPVFNVLEHLAHNRSGYANNSNGYGMSMKQFDSNTGDITHHKNTTAHKPTGMSLDMNSSIKQSVDRNPRVLIPAINTGNTHDNFIAARHQNARISDTYSQNLYVLVGVDTNLSLYDKVFFQALDEEGNIDSSTAGDYIITGKASVIRGARYYEKIELTSTGPSGSTGTT